MSRGITKLFVSRENDFVVLHLAQKALALLEEVDRLVHDARVCADARIVSRAERLGLARNLARSRRETLLQYTTL
jgi:hypothetical protein